MHASDNLALGRAGVDDNLVLCPRKPVQHLRKHLHRSANRYGNDDNVPARDGIIEADHLVHKADFLRRRGIDRVILHTEHPVRESSFLQVNGHRSADESETYD